MLFAPPKPQLSLHHLREDSNNVSIEMVYQGSMKAIESGSPEAQTTNGSDAQTQKEQAQTVSAPTTSRTMFANYPNTGPAATRRQCAYS